MQKEICKLVGYKAKKTGHKKNWWTKQTLFWNGEPIKRESEEYQELLDEAFTCLFVQNDAAQRALLASCKATLTHSIGKRKKNETVLTKQEFCSRLMDIRLQLQLKDAVEL